VVDGRQLFSDYFARNAHKEVASSPLVPHDASLLFTNAGMVQFKPVFEGQRQPAEDERRVLSVQKCVRAGGKHNDLDNVGRTSRHLTFFEMLGNFQLSEFDKREAVAHAWAFLTRELGLPEARLRVSVHEADEDTRAVWQSVTGWTDAQMASKVVALGDEDNFWAMGQTGPCGPCTEVFWDQGAEVDGDRWLEIWNIVFMQFRKEKDRPGVLPLERSFVDTGAGLERLQMVLEGKSSPYDTHLFQPLVRRVGQQLLKTSVAMPDEVQTGVESVLRKYEEAAASTGSHTHTDTSAYSLGLDSSAHATAIKVICDHLRCSVMLILDGVTPGSTGRRYVLRKIIRRALTHQYLLSGSSRVNPLLSVLAADAAASFPDSFLRAHSDLVHGAELLTSVLSTEERLFSDVLATGERLLSQQQVDKHAVGSGKLPGEVAFDMYHTNGIPLEVTEVLARRFGFAGGVDEARFEVLLEEEQTRSSLEWKGSGDAVVQSSLRAIQQDPTLRNQFEGYSASPVRSRVLAVDCAAAAPGQPAGQWVMLDPCPFYPDGKGGQAADRGSLDLGGSRGSVRVHDCAERFPGGLFVRVAEEEEQALLEVGAEVTSHVDVGRREAIAAHHSATHVLHHVLRQRHAEVSQHGSLVDEDRLRFDFMCDAELDRDALAAIEADVNAVALAADGVVSVRELGLREALDSGAVALFSEKYDADKVRVVRIGDSLELCGGTHVRSARDIYPFVVLKEFGIASGVRRVEALAGRAAHAYLRRGAAVAQQTGLLLNVQIEDVAHKVATLQTQTKHLSKQHKKVSLAMALPLMGGAPSSEHVLHSSDVLQITVLPAELDSRVVFQTAYALLKSAPRAEKQKLRVFLSPHVHSVVAVCGDASVPRKFLRRVLQRWAQSGDGAGDAGLGDKKDGTVVMAAFKPASSSSAKAWAAGVARACQEGQL
jgi:alanyl-tRNA synthetase